MVDGLPSFQHGLVRVSSCLALTSSSMGVALGRLTGASGTSLRLRGWVGVVGWEGARSRRMAEIKLAWGTEPELSVKLEECG